MMTMTNETRAALACLLLAGANAGAQETKPDPARKEEAAPRATPLQLQVVLSRYQGEKKVSSLPYTLVLAANMSPARVRMGVQLPIQMGPMQGNVQYKDVGTNLDCSAAALDPGRFRVSCTFEQSSAYSAPASAAADAPMPAGSAAAPLFRSFRSESTMILQDGQTGLHTSAADPVNGELLKAEVTLRVIR